MTIWIGLTRGVGSGKSLAAAEFVRLDMPYIGTDVISRNLAVDNGKALPVICSAFGGEVSDTQGRLDREILRDSVFRRLRPKEVLGGLISPLILEEIHFQQNQYPQAVYGIIDVPLLIENPQFLVLVGRVLVVDVAEEVQTRCVQQRSGLDESEIRRTIRTRVSRRDRLLHADDVLVNKGSTGELTAKIGRLHKLYSHAIETV